MLVNTLVDSIDALLPQTQCTRCGYPTCLDYAQAIAEGAVMGAYRFRRYKWNGKDGVENNLPELETLTIVENDKAKLRALQRGVERGVILGTAANHTRDLANEPANELPPIVLGERAQTLAKDAGLRAEVLTDGQLKQMGMGALLGVGMGSANPPRCRASRVSSRRTGACRATA